MSRHNLRRAVTGGALAAALMLAPTAGEAAGSKRSETRGDRISARPWLVQLWEAAVPQGLKAVFEAAGVVLESGGDPAPNTVGSAGEQGPCIDPDG